MSLFGRMLAFEACCAGGLWLLGKVAPEFKQQLEQSAKEQLREVNPELADQINQLQVRQ
jgi:hypothetical protein